MTVFYILMILKVNLCLLLAAFFYLSRIFLQLKYTNPLSFYTFHYLDYFKINENILQCKQK